MRTNVVLDTRLLARAMKKAGVSTMRETIDIALREYVSEPDWAGLLALRGSGVIADDYDPKAGDAAEHRVGDRRGRYVRPKAGRTRRPAR